MPLPNNALQNIEAAVEQAFEKVGVHTKKEKAAKALEQYGLSVEELAMHLANLILSAKDAVKRNAILDAFALHGINLKQEAFENSAPSIVFQVNGDNVNLNQLFAPSREVSQ
jgi:trimethylamine:corrinoid methyltransferase-like protein